MRAIFYKFIGYDTGQAALAGTPSPGLRGEGVPVMVTPVESMACRPGCAACCTVISISSPLPGMPGGKPAGVSCVNLTEARTCSLHDSPEYPAVCRNFKASRDFCGDTNEEAHRIIGELERATGSGL